VGREVSGVEAESKRRSRISCLRETGRGKRLEYKRLEEKGLERLISSKKTSCRLETAPKSRGKTGTCRLLRAGEGKKSTWEMVSHKETQMARSFYLRRGDRGKRFDRLLGGG